MSAVGCGGEIASIQWPTGVDVGMAGGLLCQGLDHVQRVSEQRQHVDFIGTQAHRWRDKFLRGGNTAANTRDFLCERAGNVSR
ncbi:hypothetical protein RSF45_004529 [Yersinia enterocolitica]|nr:hypothetical protein [Yersinia enterocolitica]